MNPQAAYFMFCAYALKAAPAIHRKAIEDAIPIVIEHIMGLKLPARRSSDTPQR